MDLPEEIELAKKQRVRDRLLERLTNREEEMAELRTIQQQFEARYTMTVGRLYAEIDDLEAQIAKEEYKLVPDDVEIKKRAEELRRLAEESAKRAEEAAKRASEWKPTAEARKAYHNLARANHPDLAIDAAEKDKRHMLMAELNEAFSSGDQAKLEQMAEDLRFSPHLVPGDTIGDELVRAIRQISQIKMRMAALVRERETIEKSELFELRQRVEAESAEGRDLLDHMANRTRSHIGKVARRLEHLKNVNSAAEEYVKETFGLDIADFREEKNKK